jgi:anti-sigma factor (TIGR02949 family)
MGCMDCRDAARRLYDYLDGEIGTADADKIREHLLRCKRCCNKAEFEKILRSILRSNVRRQKVPPSVLKRINSCLSD